MTGGQNNNGSSGATVPVPNTATPIGTCPMWGTETFEEFLFMFQNYVDTNNIETGKRNGLLINCMGNKFLKIKKLLTGEPATWTFDKIKAAGKKLYGTAINKWAARDELQNRVQQDGETIADYAVALQTLSEGCEFVATENPDNILKGRFAAGLLSATYKMKYFIANVWQ